MVSSIRTCIILFNKMSGSRDSVATQQSQRGSRFYLPAPPSSADVASWSQKCCHGSRHHIFTQEHCQQKGRWRCERESKRASFSCASLFGEGTFPQRFPPLVLVGTGSFGHSAANHWQKKRITMTDMSLGAGHANI